MTDGFVDHEVHVREHPLPGSGRLFHLTLADGALVAIARTPQTPGPTLSVTPSGADEPLVTVQCTSAEATTIAALLSGVRFVVGVDTSAPADGATLRTITLAAASPAVGRLLHELVGPDPDDAQVIAVIRDDTSDLVETDPARRCEPGDRLVLVGRSDSLERLVRFLLG
jgi:K+/H+ antiporter YhaU regulatory subunit KhtT